MFEQGVKCLSLFFIDEVAKYRQYGENGEELPGEYGKIFEQEYTDALNERLTLFPTQYQNYLRGIEVEETHRGYFSIDKKGRPIDSEIKRGSEFSDDISAYDLILKNKERLLSFGEPTRFIFSHSALREGWDNPNVFQICALKHSDSATAKRQEVGRGLRLCVNQSGDRQDAQVCGEDFVHDLNRLTVVANESYAGFVGDLQDKIREDLYERPMRASVEYFKNKTFSASGEQHTITEKEATAIYNYLIRNAYADDNGAITQKYHIAADNNQLAPLREDLAPFADEIHRLVRAIFDQSVLDEMIEDGRKPKVKNNPLNGNWKDFQELWDKINKKYAYSAQFESDELIAKSVGKLNAGLSIAKLRYTLTEGVQAGVDFEISRTETKTLDRPHKSSVSYDIIGKIAEGTSLTRRTAAAVLKGLHQEKLDMFRLNPEEFIQKTIEEINNQKAAIIVEHISYRPSAEEPYTQEIFNMSRSSQEYEKAYAAKRAIQDYVFTDGISEDSVERKFVENLEVAEEVAVYTKLPGGPKGFLIPTPVGNYSPDWAITFKKGSVKHIFFIAETKGTLDSLNIRPIEQAKISCAKKLFNEISTTGVKYHEVDSYQNMLDIIQSLK